MVGTIQNYTLDMADGTAPKPLIVKQGDTNSRQAQILLKAFNQPWTIPFGCQIYINVRKTDGTLADATCTRIDEHTVLAPITEQMTAVTGTQLGELYFLGSDGDIKTQTFPVVVYEAVMDQARIESSDDFQSLQEALRDVKASTDTADIAAQYATEQGNSARDGAQRANDAADSIQVAVDAAAAAKECESNAKDSETAAAQTQQAVTDYVEAQKAAFVGYSKRESDSKYANALTETATGEGSITVEDAWTAPVLGLEVAGKSEQAVTTGAQLLDFEQCLKEWNSKYTCSDGRVYTVNALGAGFQNPISFSYEDIKVTLSGKVRDISGSRYRIELMDSSGNSVGRIDKDTKSITVMASKIRLNFTEGGAGEYADIMINAGDTALPYEPYTGGAPSPSPDYPQDIISTGTVSTGAQLLNLSKVPDQVDNNVTSYKYTDGGLTCVFSAKNYGVRFKVSVQPNTIYTISSLDISTGGYLSISDFLQSDKSGVSVLINKGQNSKTFNSGTATELTFTMYSADDNYLTVVTRDIMLNTGDTALPWEPYTGGKPSPSVEYPQTLEVTAAGAQLFDINNLTASYLGTWKSDDNGKKITVSGTNAYSGAIYNVPMDLVRGKTITLSGTIDGKNTNAVALQCNVVSADGVSKYYIAPSKITLKDDDKSLRLMLYVNNASTPSSSLNTAVFNDVMLNYGDIPLPWEPYMGCKNVAITLTEPLRGVGEYRDRIMCRDGVWGIDRWITKLILNGSEDWVIYGNSSYISFYTQSVCLPVSMNKREGLCKQLRVMTIGGKNLNTIWLGANNKVVYTIDNQFYNDTLEDKGLANWKAYLAESPLEIITYLDAPTWEPFPDATQQALNALTTYAGTTHLTITAGGPAPTVTLDYVQDTHKALEQCQGAAKEYTDNQIAAIVAALPTATQAAIVDNQTTRLLKEVERL